VPESARVRVPLLSGAASVVTADRWRPDIADHELPEPLKGTHGGKPDFFPPTWDAAVLRLFQRWDTLRADMSGLLGAIEGATVKDPDRNKIKIARNTILLRCAADIADAVGIKDVHDDRMLGPGLQRARNWTRTFWGCLTSHAQQHMAAFRYSKESGTSRQSFRPEQKITKLGEAGAKLALVLGYKPTKGGGVTYLARSVEGYTPAAAAAAGAAATSGNAAAAAAAASSPAPIGSMLSPPGSRGSAAAGGARRSPSAPDDAGAIGHALTSLANFVARRESEKPKSTWDSDTVLAFIDKHQTELEKRVHGFNCMAFVMTMHGDRLNQLICALKFTKVVPTQHVVSDEQWAKVSEAVKLLLPQSSPA